MRKLLQALIHFLVSSGRDLAAPLIILVSGVVFQNLVSLVPRLVEGFYSRTIYPRVLGALSILSRGFSFSVGEILTCLVLLATSSGAVLFCIKLVRKKDGRRRWVLAWFRRVIWVTAVSLWLFLFAFGLNYQRPLLFELLGYEERKAQPQELEAVGSMMVESVNQAYMEAHESGRRTPEGLEIVRLLKESYDSAPE